MRLLRPIIYLSIMLIATCCTTSSKAEASASADTETPDTVVILGDSNIWLAGDSCNQPKGWVTWFRESWPAAHCLSYARSGASWTHTDSTKYNPDENTAILGHDNVIYNQVVRLRRAYEAGNQPTPTLIMVSAGGNDAWFCHKRPGEFTVTVDEAFAIPEEELLKREPSEVLSLPEAIRYDCLQLRALFPQARIVLLTPPQMSKVEPDLLLKVSDLIEQSGNRLGLHTLRLDGDAPISRDVEIQNPTYTYDGIHTNEAGAKHVADFVIEKLKTYPSKN